MSAETPHRAFHTTFYVLYLVVWLIFLWYLLSFIGVPSWIYWLFFAGTIIIGLGVIQKETLMRRRLAADGSEICRSTRTNWTILYSVLHVIAFGLIITGLVLVILNSEIPAWIWTLLIVGFLLSIVATMIHTYSPDARVWGSVMHFIALGVNLTGFVFFIIASTQAGTPYWVWLLYALAVLFSVLAGGFEHVSAKNDVLTDECCNEVKVDQCELPEISPCDQMAPTTENPNVVVEQSGRVAMLPGEPIQVSNLSSLPTVGNSVQ